jgi:FecR protein
MPNKPLPAVLYSRLWRVSLSFLIGMSLFLVLALLVTPLQAQTTINQAQIAEILDGSQVYIQDNQARVNDLATRGQRVRTGNSRTQLIFNTGAVARLSTNSVLTVGQCAQLQSGTLLVNGAVNGCTSSIAAGVRGTTYVIQVDEQGQEEVKVLEGEVTVTQQPAGLDSDAPPSASPASPSSDNPETPEAPVVLTAGQEVSTRRGERLGAIQQITEEDFVSLLTGQLFDGFAGQLPGIDRIRNSFGELFPNASFPIDLPNLPRPRPPRPRLPF